MPDYLDTLISYICQNTFDDLSQDVILRAKEVLSDSLGVIAAGSQEEEVKGLISRIVRPGDPQMATLIGAGLRTESLKAGLLNGRKIRHQIPSEPQPSIYAASSSSGGMVLKYCRRKKIIHGSPRQYGTVSGRNVLTQPSLWYVI